ncbi:potassium channel family protein [Peribacillus sp. SCS-155]|uniref:potassium channel family protein n=1 Tax=Peribacillus sedimenti TaxID=3115297 RepID=UPI0039057D2C
MLRINPMTSRFPSWLRIVRLLLVIIVFLTGFGLLIHLVEPDTFHSPLEGIWWAIVTISTVGYGDFAPQTTAGRIIGVLLIFSGAGIVTAYFATVSSVAVSSELAYMQGKKAYHHKGHVIVIGWNERSRKIIVELLQLYPEQHIVLIDESLEGHPLPIFNVHFIKGKAHTDSILLKANVKDADKVMITADHRQDEHQTDMFSILTLLAVKGLNSSVFCLVEILTNDQTSNAYRAGADGIIQTNTIASQMMVRSLCEKRMFDLQAQYVQIYSSELAAHLENQTFGDLCRLFLTADKILVGIMRDGSLQVKPPADSVIKSMDKLVFVK